MKGEGEGRRTRSGSTRYSEQLPGVVTCEVGVSHATGPP